MVDERTDHCEDTLGSMGQRQRADDIKVYVGEMGVRFKELSRDGSSGPGDLGLLVSLAGVNVVLDAAVHTGPHIIRRY